MPINCAVDRASLLRFGSRRNAGFSSYCRIAAFRSSPGPFGSHAGEGLKKLDDRAGDTRLSRRTFTGRLFHLAICRLSQRGRSVSKISHRFDRRAALCLPHGDIEPLDDPLSQRRYDRQSARIAPRRRRSCADFDQAFGARHQAALREIARRSGLDYLIMDCGETRQGELLIFEVGNAMIVHAMDPEDVFPYKATQMKKLFAAFQTMLRSRALAAHPSTLR